MKDLPASTVSTIVINWNGIEYIRSCLDSVMRQSYSRIQTVVVDNGSIDGSRDIVKENYKNVKLIENDANLGYCRALNQGIDATESEFVLCLNTDVRLEADYVEKAVETMINFPQGGMLSGKILRVDGKTLDSAGQFIGRDRRPRERGYGGRDRGQYDAREFVFSVCGAVAFYRRKMLDQVALDGQYFDEDYFAFYEDLDLGWRAQLLGWSCIYEPRAVAYHQRGATAPSRRKLFSVLSGRQFVRRSTATRYHIIKNRYMTMIKNDSLESLLADMLFIVSFEALLWCYTALSSPILVLRLPRMAKEILGSLRKRGLVQSKRTVGYDMVRKGIV